MAAPRVTLCLVLVLALLAPGASQSLAQPAASSVAPASPAAPGAMLIVENAGQWPAAARFQVWNSPLGQGTTWLAEDAIWLVVSRQVDKEEVDKEGSSHCDDPLVPLSTCLPPSSSHAVKLTFPGSNPDVRIEPFGAADTTVSYFIGNDPAQWHPAVPVWGGVRYVDLYPGVDLVVGGSDDAWRFEAASRVTTGQVRVQVEGGQIATLDGAALQLAAAGGVSSLALPTAPFPYRVMGVSSLGSPLTLVLSSESRPSQAHQPADNPGALLYSTFLGGSAYDYAFAIAVDGAGSAYMTGYTESSNFPTTPGAFDPGYDGGSDAFVAKMNADGSRLGYATFLGGSSGEAGSGIAVDGTGRVYVTGHTYSSDFPTTPGAFDTSYSDGDAFVARLNPSGSDLDFGTFLGGSDGEGGYAIAADEAGRATVVGSTSSGDFPTTPGAFDRTFGGGTCGTPPNTQPCPDAFMARLNAVGSDLDYGTFLGGSDTDGGYGISVDGANRAYVTGSTRSSDFPTTPGAFDTSYDGVVDAFVARLNASGTGLDYATFLGGSDTDIGYGIAVDGTGRALVTGNTGSSDFPTTPDAFDRTFGGGICGTPPWTGPCPDAFVARLNVAGSDLDYGTFLGSSGGDTGTAVAVDGEGRANVTGSTASNDFPTTAGAFDTSYNGGDGDTFVARLNASGSDLHYGTFLGGSDTDIGYGTAVDGTGRAYVAGYTRSSNFPTTPGAFDRTFNGSIDAFVSKLNMDTDQPCCDFDGDGTVDVDDIITMANLWGQQAGVPYDQDDDGWITIIDIQRVARWWDWPVR